MKKKRPTRRKATKQDMGKRLNEEGRESPLEVFQFTMEHFVKLAREEIAKIERGEPGSPGLIKEYLNLAMEPAVAIAPFRHAKVTPAEQDVGEQKSRVVRMPRKQMTLEEWKALYAPPAPAEKDDEPTKRVLN